MRKDRMHVCACVRSIGGLKKRGLGSHGAVAPGLVNQLPDQNAHDRHGNVQRDEEDQELVRPQIAEHLHGCGGKVCIMKKFRSL